MSHPALLLIGAGGHARVLLDALLLVGAEVLGLLDADPALAGGKVLGYPVLGGDELLRQRKPGSVALVNAIGSTKSMARRRTLYMQLLAQGHLFASVRHPSAVVSRHAATEDGAQIMAGVVIQAGAHIGENSIVNTGATVDHDCQVGAHVHVAPGVTLSGGVQVGDETHIGCGAAVIQGVRIGARCTVAAGAVVLADVPDGSTVAGVPARETRS
jgi:UDP-perosamine 4-acetyltransferase